MRCTLFMKTTQFILIPHYHQVAFLKEFSWLSRQSSLNNTLDKRWNDKNKCAVDIIDSLKCASFSASWPSIYKNDSNNTRNSSFGLISWLLSLFFCVLCHPLKCWKSWGEKKTRHYSNKISSCISRYSSRLS